jgi:hypothetical protein
MSSFFFYYLNSATNKLSSFTGSSKTEVCISEATSVGMSVAASAADAVEIDGANLMIVDPVNKTNEMPSIEKDGQHADDDSEGVEWMDEYDWDKYMSPWDRDGGRTTIVNPINVVLGKISGMTNCTINFNIKSLQSN